MAIVALSGKIGSGKDSVAKIIQIIVGSPQLTDKGVLTFLNRPYSSDILNKKFADKLKDITCILLSCTRAQLEDREFKEKELGAEWWYYTTTVNGRNRLIPYKEYEAMRPLADLQCFEKLVKLTPRLLLQLLGTECGRNIIHPNIWVNALMSEYKPKYIGGVDPISDNSEPIVTKFYPNWVISDMRFPNELEAVKTNGGIVVRVDRTSSSCGSNQFNGTQEEWEALVAKNKRIAEQMKHESETALDKAEFDFVIENNGSLEGLVAATRELLKQIKWI